MRAAPVCRTPLVMTQNRVRTGTHRVRVVRVRRTPTGATMKPRASVRLLTCAGMINTESVDSAPT